MSTAQQRRPQSETLYQRLCQFLPSGVNSAARAFKGLDTTPLIVESGCGALITDADGRNYIDYCGSWGALILGHAHPEVIAGVIDQAKKGSSFGISTRIECEIAEKVTQHYPSIEKLRFVSSGTEAVMTAARLARGHTGRRLIVKFDGHYHGHSDLFLVKAGSSVIGTHQESSSSGVPPQETLSLPFNDCERFAQAMKERGDEVAAVVLEPIAANMGVVLPDPEFLKLVRSETLRTGSLLIFDEVITGYRVGLQGAQGLYGIKPDLTTLGKIVGGGFQAGVVGGRADIVDLLGPNGPVFQAGTLSGNPVAMRAGLETLKIIEQPGFYEELQRKSDLLLGSLTGVCLNRVGSMFTLFFGAQHVRSFDDLKNVDKVRFKEFFNYLIGEGIYIAPSPFEASFISAAHTDEQLIKSASLMKEFLSL